jgi:hypothetical protein
MSGNRQPRPLCEFRNTAFEYLSRARRAKFNRVRQRAIADARDGGLNLTDLAQT